MSKPVKKPTLHAVDLSNYTINILASEDRPLFDEAVEAGKVGALRAAYVMIWLACAESLKRRFREAQKRDGSAGKIVGKIESKERDHKAVDKFVLEKACEYGFISESGHTVLSHVYEMRCLYGHPYEEAPSQEQVSHAAAVVVDHVLSNPVKLRHGFGKQLLKNLLMDRSYLDDQQSAVRAFTKDIIPRLDECIYSWLLDNYWEELEKIADDPSMTIFFRRGIWFCRKMLITIGIDYLTQEEWHNRVTRYPSTLTRICSSATIFKKIGKRAQDSLVGSILEESKTRARVLTHLERLYDADSLSNRQNERFSKYVARMKSSELRSAGLSTTTCYEKLVAELKSHNWHAQNPAIDLIVSNGPDQADNLKVGQQVKLGRNILQAGEGYSNSAGQFLENLSKDGKTWPFNVIRGIALESFTNEAKEIRFKDRHLNRVLAALKHLTTKQRNQIVAQIAKTVDAGTPKDWVDQEDFENVIDLLQKYRWTLPLVKSLKAKVLSLPADEEEP